MLKLLPPQWGSLSTRCDGAGDAEEHRRRLTDDHSDAPHSTTESPFSLGAIKLHNSCISGRERNSGGPGGAQLFCSVLLIFPVLSGSTQVYLSMDCPSQLMGTQGGLMCNHRDIVVELC